MPELPGLPADGPTTAEAVKAHLTLPATFDPAQLQPTVDAVNAVVRQLRVAADSLTYGPTPPAWPPYVSHGATMLAARLWRRRNSPAGVEVFTDQGAAYVSRNDPDVALLLQLGSYASPGVG